MSFALCLGAQSGLAGVHAEQLSEEESINTNDWSDEIDQLLSKGEYVEGQVVVGIDYSVTDVATSLDASGDTYDSSNLSSFSDADASGLLSQSEEIITVSEDAAEEAIEQDVSDDISIEFIVDDTKSTEEILYELSKDPRVVFAEPNYVGEVEETSPVQVEDLEDLSSLHNSFPDQVQDMTMYQWGMSSSVETKVKDNAANPSINVPKFGGTEGNMTGDSIIVAVIDQPVDFTNPDLKDVAFTFTDEQQSTLGCDVHGYNATWQNSDGKLSAWSSADHGTHCAGVIGASWDGKGVSGVASNVQIISIQNCNTDGNTSIINDLKAFAFVKKCYAAGIPIRITSNSYGLDQSSKALDAVVRDVGENCGVVSIFAAGNASRDNDIYMTAVNTLQDNPYAITVSATDESDKITSFSCYGRNSVDLGAPGGNILSTVNMDSSIYFPDSGVGNLFYEGFETDSPNVSVKLLGSGSDDQVKDTAVISATGGPCFAGQRSASVDVSKYQGATNYDFKVFRLEFDLGNISASCKGDGDRYFAFTFHSGEESYAYASDIVTKDSGNLTGIKSLDDYSYNSGNGWAIYSVKLDDSVDYSNFKIRVRMYIVPDDTNDQELYIDSVGIGEKTVPYGIMSGTSMACPMVAGATAVLASENRSLSADELACLVCSRVRSNASLANKTRTGGVIDLGGETSVNLSPVITSVSLGPEDKKTIKITGANFGGVAGEIVAVKDDSSVDSIWDKNALAGSIVSWSDTQVVYKLENDTQGVLKITLKSHNGKSCKNYTYLNKSSNVFEKELSLPKDMGDIYTYDAAGDYDTYGVLEGLNDKLYYIPSISKVEGTPAYKNMSCYNILTDSWTDAAPLPEWLENVSACIYDGKLVVLGETMSVVNDTASSLKNSEKRIYIYDPLVDEWTKGSTKDITGMKSIICSEDKLYLVGGKSANEYSLGSGMGKTVYSWKEASMNYPRLTAKNGRIYVYDPSRIGMLVLEDGKVTTIKGTDMPLFRSAYDADDLNNMYLGDNGFEDSRVRDGVLVPVSSGIILLGPAKADGGADTYLLDTSTLKFSDYSKRLSDSKIMSVAATVYNGYIYAIGTTLMDPDERFFRATAISTDEEQTENGGNNNQSGGENGQSGGENGQSGDKNQNGGKKENQNGGKDSQNGDKNQSSGGKTQNKDDGSSQGNNASESQNNGSQNNGSENNSLDNTGNETTPNYSNEWIQGQWYDANGNPSYTPTGSWKCNSTGWWYEDTSGWYPVSCWQKIDGDWYYFDSSGYMASNEWRDGYWLSGSGAWSYEGVGSWRKNSKGWWYEDTFGWYPYSQWQKINGEWYYFNASGYLK